VVVWKGWEALGRDGDCLGGVLGGSPGGFSFVVGSLGLEEGCGCFGGFGFFVEGRGVQTVGFFSAGVFFVVVLARGWGGVWSGWVFLTGPRVWVFSVLAGGRELGGLRHDFFVWVGGGGVPF